MKIRNGFISNSSSSSFILKIPNVKNKSFEEKIKEIDDCFNELTDGDEEYKESYKQLIEKCKNIVKDKRNRILYINEEEFFRRLFKELNIEKIYSIEN